MKVVVNKDIVKIDKDEIFHAGEYNIHDCTFEFSEEYSENLVKKALFGIGSKYYETVILDNHCEIPYEALKETGTVVLGVYAYEIIEEKLQLRYSPKYDVFSVNQGSYQENIENQEEVTPSQYEQYMQALQNGLNDIQNAIDGLNQRAEDGEFDGVGITTITSGEATQQDDSTITPVTVNKTDGTQQTFNVSAKNGIDGINGTDGNDGVTPNLQIGTVTTLEPNEQATVTRTGTDEEPLFNFGIPKGQQGEQGIQGIPGQDGTNGADGQPGRDGADGKDATINGQNTVEITTDNNVTLDQQESVLKLGLNSQLIPKQNAEGTDNTFDDGLESPLYDLGGDGKSEQIVTTGKQLFNALAITNEAITVTDNGKTITMPVVSDGNGSINTNVTLQELCPTLQVGDVVYLNFERNLGLEYNNYINLAGSNTIWYVNTSHEITQSELENTIYLYGNRFINGETKQCILTNFRITKNQSDDFEYYTGGQPSPSPDYPQEINSIEGSLEFDCRGKNEFDFNKFASDVSNVYTVEGTPENFTIKHTKGENGIYNIDLKEKTQYIISGKAFTNVANFNMVVVYTDGSKSSIVAQYDDSILNKSFSVKTTEGKTVSHISIFLYGYTKQLELKDFMIEQGTTATPYEPYIEPNEVTFNLNDEKLRSVGDVKDELVVDLDTGDYYKVENVGEVILDGSDDEGWYKTKNTNVNRFGIVLNRISGAGVMSNKWIMSNIDVINLNYILDYVDNTSIYVNFSDISENDDLATFKSWLSVNKPIVDYLLQNPTTKKLGTLSSEDLAKLKTFKGYNNVTVNTNLGLMNIRFTYGLDIKKYVDNKIAELSAQLIKGE